MDFPVVRGWDLAPTPHPIWDAVETTFRDPFRGITTSGRIVPGLFSAPSGGESTKPIAAAADAYIASLPDALRAQCVLPMDSPAWRRWTNAFPRWTPHGILLEDLDLEQRQLALGVIQESLSCHGFTTVRSVMKLNEALGEMVGWMQDTLRQYIYWFTIFGEPSSGQPWGWQMIGHHLDLHCVAFDRHLVVTPSFLGAEICEADDGPFAGTKVFDSERADALSLMRALDEDQRRTAILFDSISTADLPPELNHPSNGRMRAGAGADNAVIPYEGLPAGELRASQRDRLLALIEAYLGRSRDADRAIDMRQIDRHLEDTYLAWIGGTGIDDAFYYKIHSPVVLIEYDCHASVFFQADEPVPFHVHTVVRTPNGNDYGTDLLAQHYARFPHP